MPLVENVTQALMSPRSEPICKCHERLGNDFWFLPMESCLFDKSQCTKHEFFAARPGTGDEPDDIPDPFRGGCTL